MMEFESLQKFQGWLLDSKFPKRGMVSMLADRIWHNAHLFYASGKRPRDWKSYYANKLQPDVERLIGMVGSR